MEGREDVVLFLIVSVPEALSSATLPPETTGDSEVLGHLVESRLEPENSSQKSKVLSQLLPAVAVLFL